MRRDFEDALESLRTVALEAFDTPDLARIAERAGQEARGQRDSVRFLAAAASVVVLLTCVVSVQRALTPTTQSPGIIRHYPKAPWLPGGQPAAPLVPPTVSEPGGLGAGARVPVVAVPTTAYVGPPAAPSVYHPKSVVVWAPESAAHALAAYAVTFGLGDVVYFVGPRAMTGSAQIAADGSFAVTLHSQGVRVRIFSEPACVGCAVEAAAPYFAQARRDAAPYGGYGGATIAQLPVSVRDLSQGLLVYGYRSVARRAVYGLVHYGQQGGSGGRFFSVMVEVQPDRAQMAGYILSGALEALGPPAK